MNFDDTARFFGPSTKLCPELVAPPSKRATKVCRNCRNVEVQGIKRYCGKCPAERERKSHREAMRRKRALDVTKTKYSPIGAEALTTPRIVDGYNDPQSSERVVKGYRVADLRQAWSRFRNSNCHIRGRSLIGLYSLTVQKGRMRVGQQRLILG
jgi:hypothetical protein